MVQTLLLLLGITSPSRSLVSCTEVNVGNGIADIVIAELSEVWHQYRTLALIPPRWVFALISMPYRVLFTTAQFAVKTGVTESTAREMLRIYVSAGFCKETQNAWLKVKSPRPIFRNIDAVEVKLRAWQRALFQARRYQSFANRSWVVLDSGVACPPESGIGEFQKFNVGLALLQPNGCLTSLVVPRKRQPTSPLSWWQCTGEVLRSID